jgi:stage 0 sporulation protein B (sporulation initiation phosphotransferase)
MEKEIKWDIVEVLRHSRHDWLNKLQLIKGNLDLDRIERAKEIIDEIVVGAQQESKLSNLNIPHFTSLLFRTNWERHSFQLEYEVLPESGRLKICDLLLTRWTDSLYMILDSSIQPFQENHLSISVDTHENGARFFFDFRGIITNKELIEQFLVDSQFENLEIDVKELSEQELALEVFVPSTKGRI